MSKTVLYEAASYSSSLYVKLAPSDVGMFRFLLEAYDNLALFSVLDKYGAILKVFYSPHQEKEVMQALQSIQTLVPLYIYSV